MVDGILGIRKREQTFARKSRHSDGTLGLGLRKTCLVASPSI